MAERKAANRETAGVQDPAFGQRNEVERKGRPPLPPEALFPKIRYMLKNYKLRAYRNYSA